MRQDMREDAGGDLNDDQREAIRRIKEEFGGGYFLVLLPGGRFEGEPATHMVISKKHFGAMARRLRRS